MTYRKKKSYYSRHNIMKMKTRKLNNHYKISIKILCGSIYRTSIYINNVSQPILCIHMQKHVIIIILIIIIIIIIIIKIVIIKIIIIEMVIII